jgi:hypothetical protein
MRRRAYGVQQAGAPSSVPGLVADVRLAYGRSRPRSESSVIPDVSEDEPDLASLAGLECAVDNGDITPVIGGELLHE